MKLLNLTKSTRTNKYYFSNDSLRQTFYGEDLKYYLQCQTLKGIRSRSKQLGYDKITIKEYNV